MIARMAPLRLAMTGKVAAGWTTREDPTTIKTPAASLYSCARLFAACDIGAFEK
jgi:hypothetical protein